MQRQIHTPCLILTGVLAVATFALLALSALNFRTSNPGSSAEYWEYMCGVQLPEFHGHHMYSGVGGTYPLVEGRVYYYAQTHHQEVLYSLPAYEVLEDVPLVRGALANPKKPDPSKCEAFPKSACAYFIDGANRRYECDKELGAIEASAFDTEQLEALRMDLVEHSPFASSADRRNILFLERLSRGKRVWMTLLFEGIVLGAWLWFVLGAPPIGIHWRWRAALSPFLLFIPYFLGYAPMTFTNGPSGGFVYPIYLMLVSLPMYVIPCSTLDAAIWGYVPNVLGGLSQMPGSPMAASSWSCVGPASSLFFGAALVVSISVVGLIVARMRN